VTKAAKILKRCFRAIFPSCQEATRIQSELLDHPISVPRRAALWLHLIICKWCRRYGRQIRMLRRFSREHPDEIAGPAHYKLSAEAGERIKQKLRQGE